MTLRAILNGTRRGALAPPLSPLVNLAEKRELNKGNPPDIDLSTIADMHLEHSRNAVENHQTFREGALSASSALVEDPLTFHCYREQVFQLLCSPRSATQLPPIVWKITDGGTSRHADLDRLFSAMAKEGYQSASKTFH